MPHTLRRSLLLALPLSLGLLAAPGTGLAQSSLTAGTLSLSGEGEVRAAPDQATLTLGVVTQGATAADALAENTTRLTGVFAVLDAAGIDGTDRQTSGLSIQPFWDSPRGSNPPPPRIIGYTVSNTVTIRVRDLGRLGAVLDAVVRDGANSFQGLSFGLSDPGPMLDAARRAAVADARRKATLYAEALEVELGPVLSVTESGRMAPPMMMRAEAAIAMASDAMPVPISEGQVTVSAEVSITWALDQ